MKESQLSIKIPEKMHKALRRIAARDFTSISSVVKRAIHKYLLDIGVNWRKEE